MSIFTRVYVSSDYAELRTILNRVYDSSIDQVTLEDKYITPCRTILVAVDNTSNSIIGCAFIEFQEDYIRPAKVGFVTYVAVDESARRQGVGRALFRAIESLCADKKVLAIELTSANHRTGAHAFYESIGFTKKKTTVFIKEL